MIIYVDPLPVSLCSLRFALKTMGPILCKSAGFEQEYCLYVFVTCSCFPSGTDSTPLFCPSDDLQVDPSVRRAVVDGSEAFLPCHPD